MGKLKLHLQHLPILAVLPFVIHHANFTLFPIVVGVILFLFPYSVTHTLSDMGDSGFFVPSIEYGRQAVGDPVYYVHLFEQ